MLFIKDMNIARYVYFWQSAKVIEETNHFISLLKPYLPVIAVTDETEFLTLLPISSFRGRCTESTPALLYLPSAMEHCYSQNIKHRNTYDFHPSLNNTEFPRESVTEEKRDKSRRLPIKYNVSSNASPHKIVRKNEMSQWWKLRWLPRKSQRYRVRNARLVFISSPSTDVANNANDSDMVL